MHAAVAWQRDANAIARRRRDLAPLRPTYAARLDGSRRDGFSLHEVMGDPLYENYITKIQDGGASNFSPEPRCGAGRRERLLMVKMKTYDVDIRHSATASTSQSDNRRFRGLLVPRLWSELKRAKSPKLGKDVAMATISWSTT